MDYEKAGQIHDDQVFSELVGRMPEGSTLTCLMDCCHSGSVLDLRKCTILSVTFFFVYILYSNI